MRVLVTRPQWDAEGTANRLVQAGHDAIIAPVLRIEPTGAALSGAGYDGVIVTSVHAFDAVIPDQRFAGLFDKPLHSIGTRSAELAHRANIFEDGVSGPDAKALATALLRQLPRGTRLIYLAGRDRKPDLELALSAGGLALETVVVYDARAVEALPHAAEVALRNDEAQAVLHFSRRSASIFTDLAVDASLKAQAVRLRHICISPACAAGLSALGVNAEIAASPNEEAMIELLG